MTFSPMVPFPDISEVDRIAALGDPVLRNLQITQAYSELSRAVAARTGTQANWCTFATWASKQAGQSIRKEDLRRALERAVRAALAPPQAPQGSQSLPADDQAAQQAAQNAAILHSLDLRLAADRAAEAVARGNHKVFAEIGRIFAAFLTEFGADAHADNLRLQRFCDALRPGDPPGGQEYLRRAFARLYRAFFERESKTRAELLLFANIEIGYHEQTRLQPEIGEAMNAASVNLMALARLLVTAGMWQPLVWPGKPVRRPGGPAGNRAAATPAGRMVMWLARQRLYRLAIVDDAFNALANGMQAQMRAALTDLLMTIQFPPDRTIDLGTDLAAPFPAMLRTLADAELSAFISSYDSKPDAADGSGARDWADLPQRLRFIIRLFRCYQDSFELFTPPFLPEQTAVIKLGHLPSGRL